MRWNNSLDDLQTRQLYIFMLLAESGMERIMTRLTLCINYKQGKLNIDNHINVLIDQHNEHEQK